MEDRKNEIIEETVEENIEETVEVNNSFVNKMVSNNEDKNSDLKYIIGIVLFLVILLGGGISGLVVLNNSEKATDSKGSINNILNNENDSSKDDSILSEEDKNKKKINIYQNGYTDSEHIAYVYVCKTDKCDLMVTEEVFILYDEGIVKYREIADFESEKINKIDTDIETSKLNLEGFEKVNGLVQEDNVLSSNIYVVNNEIYIIGVDENKLILSYEEYSKKGLNNITKIDNLVLFDGFVYDYVNGEKLYYFEDRKVEISSYGKLGEFYYFDMKNILSKTTFYFFVNYSLKETDIIEKNMAQIEKDRIYYIDQVDNLNNVAYYVDSNGNRSVVSEEGINSFFVFDSKLFYLDTNYILNVKNLIDNSIYNSEIVIKNKIKMLSHNNGFEILEIDHTVLKTEEFNQYRKELGVKDKDFNLCLIDLSECSEHGNLIKLDKDGKFISKEIYYKVVSTPSE